MRIVQTIMLYLVPCVVAVAAYDKEDEVKMRDVIDIVKANIDQLKT